jgi:hypothetical protein
MSNYDFHNKNDNTIRDLIYQFKVYDCKWHKFERNVSLKFGKGIRLTETICISSQLQQTSKEKILNEQISKIK